MKRSLFIVMAVVAILFLAIFAFNLITTQEPFGDAEKDSSPILQLTGDEISSLDTNAIVRFPATLVKRFGSDCIELFAPGDFERYEGDAKNAIYSRSTAALPWHAWFGMNYKVVVTGKLVFIKDSPDPATNCGIVTGHIFEITKIEYE
jgi:hypothetical protein